MSIFENIADWDNSNNIMAKTKTKKRLKKTQPKKKLGLFDTLAKTNPIEVAMIRCGYGVFKL